ncbi:response regulator [Paenibacillus hodogayensis]|uniref:Response regulator n=1 Tax=Paenibacillus hodogayensis TaxID=279208 RepID=A0ABV5W8E8_9BACL
MWKVLLVEDEVFVRRSLRQLVNWEEMGFTITAEAGDGREALERMREQAPDLVIADIIMPEMDGIELLKQTRSEGLDCRFVMLTCMNEFEYARQALEYGASGYLLKLSMNKQSLGEALSKVDRELAGSLRIRSQQVSESFVRFYGQMWQAIHGGGSGEAATGQGPAAAAMSFADADGKPYASVWVGSFLHGEEPFTLDDFRKLGLVSTDSRTVMHLFPHSGQTTVFVWNPASGPVGRRANGAAAPWAFACSPVSAPRDVLRVWKETLRALDRHWYESAVGGAAVPASGGAAAEEAPSLDWKTEREWIQSFEQRHMDEFRSRFRSGWSAIGRQRLPMALVKETAVRIDRTLARIAGHGGVPADSLLGCTTHRALGERLLERAERYAERWTAGAQPVTGHPEIDKALAYIHRHLHEDVTLRGLAALVTMDEAYFSSLFKKKTGVTLIHYVQQARVGQAKKLLEETVLPVSEIGERVGFPNTNYFIKIFKRWTERTPNEYRHGSS